MITLNKELFELGDFSQLDKYQKLLERDGFDVSVEEIPNWRERAPDRIHHNFQTWEEGKALKDLINEVGILKKPIVLKNVSPENGLREDSFSESLKRNIFNLFSRKKIEEVPATKPMFLIRDDLEITLLDSDLLPFQKGASLLKTFYNEPFTFELGKLPKLHNQEQISSLLEIPGHRFYTVTITRCKRFKWFYTGLVDLEIAPYLYQ